MHSVSSLQWKIFQTDSCWPIYRSWISKQFWFSRSQKYPGVQFEDFYVKIHDLMMGMTLRESNHVPRLWTRHCWQNSGDSLRRRSRSNHPQNRARIEQQHWYATRNVCNILMIKCTGNHITIYDFARGTLTRSWPTNLCTSRFLADWIRMVGIP